MTMLTNYQVQLSLHFNISNVFNVKHLLPYYAAEEDFSDSVQICGQVSSIGDNF